MYKWQLDPKKSAVTQIPCMPFFSDQTSQSVFKKMMNLCGGIVICQARYFGANPEDSHADESSVFKGIMFDKGFQEHASSTCTWSCKQRGDGKSLQSLDWLLPNGIQYQGCTGCACDQYHPSYRYR